MILELVYAFFRRRQWQPTPVFLPGESHGRRSLLGCHLWGCTQSDTTDATWQQQQHAFFIWTIVLREFNLTISILPRQIL